MFRGEFHNGEDIPDGARLPIRKKRQASSRYGNHPDDEDNFLWFAGSRGRDAMETSRRSRNQLVKSRTRLKNKYTTSPSHEFIPRPTRGGFTVVEMALATTMLMVGIMAISAATLRMHHLGRQTREHTLAHNALSQMGERLNSASAIAALKPSTWAETLLSAYSPVGAVGNDFRVEGLTPIEGEENAGSIALITDETLTDARLAWYLACLATSMVMAMQPIQTHLAAQSFCPPSSQSAGPCADPKSR
jgi:Tfp pilus assembly protein PilV